MTALTIAAITFVCAFGAAVIGAYLHDRLPAPHLSRESQDVVRLAMGLIATMTAILLGLVTTAARSTFDAHETAIRNSAVNILTLDRHLARYGSETKSTRALLRSVVVFQVETTLPAEGRSGDVVALPTPKVEEIENQILHLSPATEAQRWFKDEALALSDEVLKIRWRVFASGDAIPPVFIGVVIFWLSVTFASFGLYAPRNATVVSVLFIAAVSVAAALFLIVELDGPFEGAIRASGGPFRFALDNLGR